MDNDKQPNHVKGVEESERREVGAKLEEMGDWGRRCLSHANALQTIYMLVGGFLEESYLFSLSLFYYRIFNIHVGHFPNIIWVKSIETSRPVSIGQFS